MIKLSLKKLEKNLGFHLQNNIFCLAIDIATKSGIALIHIFDGKASIDYFTLKIESLPKDIENKNEKYEQHLRLFSKLFEKELLPKISFSLKNYSLLVIENSFLKMNVVTFGFLRAIQGIAYEKLHRKFSATAFYFPITARKMVGFESRLGKKAKPKDKKKEIMKWVGNIIEKEIKDDNCADAILLGLAGLKK